jgi:hypothetical protein
MTTIINYLLDLQCSLKSFYDSSSNHYAGRTLL